MTRVRRKSTVCYVGLGSNLDNPAEQVERAFDFLRAVPGVQLLSRSSLYRSGPIGPLEQPDYVNAVAKVSTTLDARELLEALKRIERLRGRKRGMRWGPRILDLDLLVYGDEQIDELRLKVPHPGIAERNFVLLPLLEIAPGLTVPGIGRVSDIPVNKYKPPISRIDA